jgi:hypothetical protein
MSRRSIMNINVFKGAQLVAKNTTETSTAIDLRRAAQNGQLSIEYTLTGEGTATIGYTVCSSKGGTYFTPTGATTIATALTKSSGTSGHGGLSFTPPMYPWMKIYVTETKNSGTDTITATIILNVQ